MEIRSRQFALLRLAGTGGFETLFVVPAGHRALLKWCSIISGNANPGYLIVAGHDGGVNYGYALLQKNAVQDVLYSAADLYMVLEAGEELVALVSTSSGADTYCAAGGVLFEL